MSTVVKTLNLLEKQSAPTFTGPSEDIPGVVGDWKFSISSAKSDETESDETESDETVNL